MGLEGVSKELQKLAEANMDQAPNRRCAREAFKEIQMGLDHCLFRASYPDVIMKEEYVQNSRGLEIFTKSWLPESSPLKATVFICHGYGDTITFFLEGFAKKLASSGYGVFGMDYPGFGLSDGLHGHITSFERLVDDVLEHFLKIKGEYKSLPSFLFGESMGGAVALKLHLKQPNAWSGAVLLAPMCKIADDMIPPKVLTQFLKGIAKLLPKEKLVPQKDFAVMAFKDVEKRKMAIYNVISYKGKPRLQTAVELLYVSQDLERQLEKISMPLFILHGEADVITDPAVSKALYERASSEDKKLHLYKDAWHCIIEGESDDMAVQVLDDIICWLDEHSGKGSSN